jgi:hypothetical protein
MIHEKEIKTINFIQDRWKFNWVFWRLPNTLEVKTLNFQGNYDAQRFKVKISEV